MSWFQSLRDDFSLRPFEIEHTRSDRAAMASGPPDVTANQEPAEVQEECSGKKKSKFQTFKKFFARKKRKESPSAAGADAGLKASQSSDNLSKTSENNTLTRSEKDKGSGSKISLGSKALSHDSVFVSDSSEANEALGASQDSIHGKVKSIQLQLKQAIKLGSPPSLICMKGRQDAGTMSEDDGLPCSPPEYTTLHTVMNQAQGNSSISLEGVDHDDDQLSCATSSRAVSPLVVPGDFSQPASPYGCLDNSAAKHKMGLRHKACNKRKPASRLELKAETDSVDEVLNNSITEALAAHEQQKPEGVSFDELKLKVEREEDNEEEEDEEMEGEQPQSSSQSLLRDQEEGEEEGEEEREEGEEESEAGQDVSHGPDTSPPPQPSLSEEDVSDAQPLPCSTPSSSASPVDSPRATPEPPAGPREYVLDPAGLAYGAEENRDESALALTGEKERVQEDEEEEEEVEEKEEGEKEEESSFLQEVLSSLKTPLASCSLGVETEDVVLKTEEEVKEKEVEEFDIEEGEEMTEEEPEVNKAATSGSVLLAHTTEEEEDTATVPWQEEVVPEEELKEEETEVEEEVAVEQISQHGQAEKEADEVKLEDENDAVTTQTDIQVEEEAEEEEEYQSEGEEEAIELEKEPDVEEEGWEKTEEADEEVEKKEGKERVEEAEEAVEDEDDAEEMTERFPDAADDEAQIAVPLQEADEGAAVVEHDTTKLGDEVLTEVGDEGFTAVHECHANDKQDPGDEREDEEERVENAVEIESTKVKAEPEEDVEAKQQVADQTEQDLEQDSPSEVSPLDLKEVENDQREAAEQVIVCSKPSSLSIPKSTFETQSQESESISPSKTSTTTIHINLVSPSSEKVTSFFQQSPTAALPDESKSASHAAEQATVCAEEEEAVDTAEETKEEKQSDLEEEATPTDSVEATINQPFSSSDQGKVRFTISPAWQRKQSLTSPSSPPACLFSSPSTATGPGVEEAEAAPAANTEPASSAKVELVLSPGRVRSAGSITAKPQNSAAPPPCSGKPEAAAGAKGSSVIVEGNPDNPFGVRLRKTSALQRFSSEEENTESPTEAPTQPTSCKVESPQPISVKPPISQPGSNKPALPKKPDVHGDGGKTKRISEPAPGHVVSGASDSPSWISVAKQKQKIYKENSLDEITVKKEEPERKNSLPTYVTSAANREQSNKTAEPASKVSLLETSKPSASVDKEARRPLSPPTPVPLQPSKSPSLPCPVPPKPHVLPSTAKPPPQPNSALRSLSPPTPVPVSQKSPSCTSPPSVTKAAPSLPLSKTTQPQSTTVTSPPFSSRTTLESTGSRAPGISGQVPSSQRGLPAPALPQDEPPWMALAKKKAKAWSEMPQIVQ